MSTPKLPDPPKTWAGKLLVVTVDGPLPHAWYFRDDWHERVATAKRMGREPGKHGDYILGYQLTGTTVAHPDYAVSGEGLRWAA